MFVIWVARYNWKIAELALNNNHSLTYCVIKIDLHEPMFRRRLSIAMSPSYDWPLDPSIFIYKEIYIELNSWNFFIKNNRSKTWN